MKIYETNISNCNKCGCEIFRYSITEYGETESKDTKKWFFNPTGEGYLCIDCYREVEKEKENLKEEQERIMKKYGMTNWKYISIATKSESTKNRLLELGFVEPIKKSIRYEGGCWNLYYSTESQEDFVNMQETIRKEDLDYIGMELNPMATADYIKYLEGVSDPRD